MSIDDTLKQRQATHGVYPEQAATAQYLKATLAASPNWKTMPPYMRESLELICTKISRTCHGNWQEPDHFVDIGGYSELVVRELKR